MSEVKRYTVYPPRLQFEGGELVLKEKVVVESDYDAVVVQHEEGLQREAELRAKVDQMYSEISQLTETTFSQQQIMENLEAQRDDFKQRLAEAENLLRHSRRLISGEYEGGILFAMKSIDKRLDFYEECNPVREAINDFLVNPGCADWEKENAV